MPLASIVRTNRSTSIGVRRSSTLRLPSSRATTQYCAQHAGVPVAHARRAAELPQSLERLHRLRADGDITQADDLVDVFPVEVGEHVVECSQVAVDVRDQGQPHRAYSEPNEGLTRRV